MGWESKGLKHPLKRIGQHLSETVTSPMKPGHGLTVISPARAHASRALSQ
jgi:hypothetical protein